MISFEGKETKNSCSDKWFMNFEYILRERNEFYVNIVTKLISESNQFHVTLAFNTHLAKYQMYIVIASFSSETVNMLLLYQTRLLT